MGSFQPQTPSRSHHPTLPAQSCSSPTGQFQPWGHPESLPAAGKPFLAPAASHLRPHGPHLLQGKAPGPSANPAPRPSREATGPRRVSRAAPSLPGTRAHGETDMGPDQPSTHSSSWPGLPVRTHKVMSRSSSRRDRLARGSEWRGHVCGDGSRHHTASRRAGLRPLRRGQPWTPAEVETLTPVSTLPCQQGSPKEPVSTRQSAQVGASLRLGDRPPRKQPRAPLPHRTWSPEPTHPATQPPSKDTHRQHEHGSRRAGQPVSPRKAWASRGTLWTEGPGEWVSARGGAGLGRGDGAESGPAGNALHKHRATQDPRKGMCRPQAQRRGLRCRLRTGRRMEGGLSGSRGIRDRKAGACHGGGGWRAEATLREVVGGRVLGLPRPQE